MEVERRVEQPKNLRLEAPQGVGVLVGSGEHSKMSHHPLRQRLLINGFRVLAVRLNGPRACA